MNKPGTISKKLTDSHMKQIYVLRAMSKDAVLASDMPVTIHDINVAAQGRIGLVILPSANADVITMVDKYNMALITTGMTNILY